MFLMRENEVTLSTVMEVKIDVTKNQNGIQTALNNVTRFCPVNELWNKTFLIFLHCLYRHAVLEYTLNHFLADNQTNERLHYNSVIPPSKKFIQFVSILSERGNILHISIT